MEFNKSVVDYSSIKRSPGAASNDWRPDLQRTDKTVPLLDMKNLPRLKGVGVSVTVTPALP
jgi:hypothetical protein